MIIALPVSLWWNRNRSIEDGSREELGMDEERRVQDVLARYVRTTDRRDGKAQGALFTDDATVEIQIKTGQGQYEKLGGPLTGGAGVAFAVDNFMTPHPQGGSSHHTTSDHIIEISGDQAHMKPPFIVYEGPACQGPEGGRPDDARRPQGTVRTIASGFHDTDLRL